jgi:DnaK suppressor protein
VRLEQLEAFANLGLVAAYHRAMEPERARELLAQERSRIEEALGSLDPDGPLEGDDRVEANDLDSEDLYQDEYDEGRRRDLQEQLAAVERAEARLAAGTYGLSIESGKSIPEARLEARPTAERTVEEEERLGRR